MSALNGHGWLGAEGQALAGWASALLSMAAVFIAVYVFVDEQQRDRKTEVRRQRAFAEGTIRIIDEAVPLVQAQQTAMYATSSSIPMVKSSGVSHVAEPLRDLATALQLATPGDVHLALTLARVKRTLTDMVEYRGLAVGLISQASFNAWLNPLIADLGARRSEMSDALARMKKR